MATDPAHPGARPGSGCPGVSGATAYTFGRQACVTMGEGHAQEGVIKSVLLATCLEQRQPFPWACSRAQESTVRSSSVRKPPFTSQQVTSHLLRVWGRCLPIHPPLQLRSVSCRQRSWESQVSQEPEGIWWRTQGTPSPNTSWVRMLASQWKQRGPSGKCQDKNLDFLLQLLPSLR